MDELETVRNRIKYKKKKDTGEKGNSYINNLITRCLVALILFFALISSANFNSKVEKFIEKDILDENLPFTKISALYNRYFGSVIPIRDEGVEASTVFDEKIIYKDLKDYKDGYVISVDKHYLVPIVNSGIVVFCGEKENYGNTVIIQGIDEIEYWYGNLDNITVSLYDYVSKGSMLGNTKDDKLYMVFQKGSEFLGFDEVME